MTKVISYDQFEVSRVKKVIRSTAETVHALLMKLDSSQSELLDRSLVFALINLVLSTPREMVGDFWLCNFAMDNKFIKQNPEIAPDVQLFSVKSEVGYFFDDSKQPLPVLDIKELCHSTSVPEMSTVEHEAEHSKLLGFIKEYTEKHSEKIWGYNCYFYALWQYVCSYCHVKIVEETDDKLVLMVWSLNHQGLVELTFHLDTIVKDCQVIEEEREKYDTGGALGL